MKPPDEQISKLGTVIPYYVTGAISFVIIHFLLIISIPDILTHYFQPKLLAVAHLFVLGWATMIILGATNQLIPVISEHKLYNEFIPKFNILLLVFLIPVLVLSFWNFQFTYKTYIAAGGVIIGILLHTINIYRTISAGPQSIITDILLMAHAWLAITAIVGILLLINLTYPIFPEEHLHYLKIHAPIGMAGWFMQLIIGVSSRLMPMFLLSRKENLKLLNITFYTMNGGLTLFLIEGMVFKSFNGSIIYIAMVTIGLVSYGLYIKGCYQTALRKKMDAAMKQTFVAITFIIATVVMLIAAIKATNSTNISTAFGFCFLGGLVSTIIMGQTFKTLPFIVWMHITKPNQLPDIMPKDLYKEKTVWLQMMLYLPGILAFLVGLIVKNHVILYCSGGLMFLGSIIYTIHVVSIVNKLKHKYNGY